MHRASSCEADHSVAQIDSIQLPALPAPRDALYKLLLSEQRPPSSWSPWQFAAPQNPIATTVPPLGFCAAAACRAPSTQDTGLRLRSANAVCLSRCGSAVARSWMENRRRRISKQLLAQVWLDPLVCILMRRGSIRLRGGLEVGSAPGSLPAHHGSSACLHMLNVLDVIVAAVGASDFAPPSLLLPVILMRRAARA